MIILDWRGKMCFDLGCAYNKSDIIIVCVEDKNRNSKNLVRYLWRDLGVCEVA